MKRLHHCHNCFTQETETAEKERERICNLVLDLKDQKSDVEGAIWHLEQERKRKKDELEQLEARKREIEAFGLNNAGPVVSSSVSGC